MTGRPRDSALRPGVHAPAGFGGTLRAAPDLEVHPSTVVRCQHEAAHRRSLELLRRVAPFVVIDP